jgi:hypothetical protein
MGIRKFWSVALPFSKVIYIALSSYKAKYIVLKEAIKEYLYLYPFYFYFYIYYIILYIILRIQPLGYSAIVLYI